MAVGDWVVGSKLRPLLINVGFVNDGTGTINHVGIGYEIVSPNGQTVRQSGYTFTPTATQQTTMQVLAAAILTAAEAYEGLTALV